MTYNADELRKALTAAEAYNRYMEKRVALLEMEVKMISSVQHMPSTKGSNGSNGDSGEDMTAGKILEELMKVRGEFKQSSLELKRTKKELSMTVANLQHFTAKEQQQRQRANQLADEVRQLRSILPPHLFETNMNLSADGSSRGGSYFSSPTNEFNRRGGSAASEAGTADESHAEPATTWGSAAAKSMRLSQEVLSAVKKLTSEASRAAEAMINIPTATADGIPLTLPKSFGAIQPFAVEHSLPLDFSKQSYAEREIAWRQFSSRLHNVLKFSKKEWIEGDALSAQLQQLPGFGGVANTFLKSFSQQSGGPGGAAAKKIDRTQFMLELLLQQVDKQVDSVKELILELPRCLSLYLQRCRVGQGIVVDGQRINTSASLAVLKSQAQTLANEMKKIRDDFTNALATTRQGIQALLTLVVSCVDASLGVNSYRNVPAALKLIMQLEGHVAVLLGLDVALEKDIVKDCPSAMENVLSLANPTAAAPGTESSPPSWHVTGLDVELEVRRISEIDPKLDRLEKLDINAIKKMFPDALAFVAQSSGVNPSLAEAVSVLEGVKSSASQLVRLFRGENVTTSATAASSASGPEEHTTTKGVQCNLQQQKMQMTENELHIARLANIRSNWFEAAVLQKTNGEGSPGRGSSPSGVPLEARANTPRSGRKSPRTGATATTKVSAAELQRMIDTTISKFKLDVPVNFAPIKANRSTGGFRGSCDDGYLYQFGRKVISLHIVGGSSLAVHIGGGYITFEEFCLKYGPAEVLMMDRHTEKGGGSPSAPRAVTIDSDAVMKEASQRQSSASPPIVPTLHGLRGIVRATLAS